MGASDAKLGWGPLVHIGSELPVLLARILFHKGNPWNIDYEAPAKECSEGHQ